MNHSISNCPYVTKPKLGTYEIDRTIGKGIFSLVKLATHTITGLQLAIKIIDKTRLDAENLLKINREADILKRLHHPHIVKLFQVMETPRLLCLVMEYLPNGEVFDYIATHGRFPEAKARPHFFDLLSAIDYAHCCGVVHRDLKAENLLFDSDMKIKLIDFSFGTQHTGALLTTWCGSPPYAAPEIFNGEPYLGTKADIWSLGVLLYVMVCGTLPFDAQPLPDLKSQVLSANFRVPYWLSTNCEKLLRSMMAKSASKRPTAREIFQHPWLTQPLPKTTPPLLLPPSSSNDSCGYISHGASSLSTDYEYETTRPSDDGHGKQQSNFHSPPSRPPHNRCSFVEPGSDLAADLEMGKIDELPILLMESYGMKRPQILESLNRRAYDHLMATYLLLGEKLRSRRLGLAVLPTLNRLASSVPNNPLCESSDVSRQKHSYVDSAVDMKFSSGCQFDELSVPSKCHGSSVESGLAVVSSDPPCSAGTAQPIQWGSSTNSTHRVATSCFDPLPLLSHSPAEISIDLHTNSVVTCPTSCSGTTLAFQSPSPFPQTSSNPPFDSDQMTESDQTHQIATSWLPPDTIVSTDSASLQCTNFARESHRRGLVRRKYGVVTPPACLNQLAQTILAQRLPDEEITTEDGDE